MTNNADTVIVLDFETTGLSPKLGDRAIEIGAVRLEKGMITDRFQQLMNPGFRISSFIENYTGITNEMLREAPPCHVAMDLFADFIEGCNLVAHNASFDKRFLDAELAAINRRYSGSIACSMLVARRIYQNAPDHKLGSLVKYKNIPNDGVFHRALADSEMTARLWLQILEDINDRFSIGPQLSFKLMQQLSRKPKSDIDSFLSCRS